MAFDAHLAARVRASFGGDPSLSEKAMFGALAFLVDGRIAVVVNTGGLWVRAGDAAGAAELLRTTPARPAEMGVKEMRGWVQVDAEHLWGQPDLDEWIAFGIAAASAKAERSRTPNQAASEFHASVSASARAAAPGHPSATAAPPGRCLRPAAPPPRWRRRPG